MNPIRPVSPSYAASRLGIAEAVDIIDRNRVIRRDGFRCRICNIIPRFPTLDHIIPKTLGGSNRQDNLQMLCIACHRIKDAHFPKLSNYRHFTTSSHPHSPFEIIIVILKIESLDYLPGYDCLGRI